MILIQRIFIPRQALKKAGYPLVCFNTISAIKYPTHRSGLQKYNTLLTVVCVSSQT